MLSRPTFSKGASDIDSKVREMAADKRNKGLIGASLEEIVVLYTMVGRDEIPIRLHRCLPVRRVEEPKFEFGCADGVDIALLSASDLTVEQLTRCHRCRAAIGEDGVAEDQRRVWLPGKPAERR